MISPLQLLGERPEKNDTDKKLVDHPHWHHLRNCLNCMMFVIVWSSHCDVCVFFGFFWSYSCLQIFWSFPSADHTFRQLLTGNLQIICLDLNFLKKVFSYLMVYNMHIWWGYKFKYKNVKANAIPTVVSHLPLRKGPSWQPCKLCCTLSPSWSCH